MKFVSILLLVFILPSIESSAQTNDLSKRLFITVNAYRVTLGLHEIPDSPSLNGVAMQHAIDLQENQPDRGRCNLHSWSRSKDWTGCCYRDARPDAACMWDKPREITRGKYTGNGYEIAAWLSEDITPEYALELWQNSKGHHDVMINSGVWSTLKWRAMGAAIYGNYAVVWFGETADAQE